MFAARSSKPIVSDKPKRLSRTTSAQSAQSSVESPYKITRSSSDIPVRRIHTRTSTMETQTEPRLRKTPASRTSTISAHPYNVPSRENSRTLRTERTLSAIQQDESIVKGRISEATRRRIQQRAATMENVPNGKQRAEPAPQPKRLALGEVINSETGRPAHVNKRVKSQHTCSDVQPVVSAVPAKRITTARTVTTMSKPKPRPVAKKEKENMEVATLRRSTTTTISKARPPVQPTFRPTLPVEFITPLPFRIRMSEIEQMRARQFNDMIRAKAVVIRTPQRPRGSQSGSQLVKRQAPGAPKCKTIFPNHVTPEPALYQLGANGEYSDEMEMVFLPEYAEEIHAFLRYKEDSTCPTPDYAGSAIQPELTWDMRQVLVNWLVQLHAHFNLAPESFYLAINVMDRFLGKRCVLVHNFHLVAVCSLMLAAKYEQHCAPPLKDLVAVCEDQYGIGVLRTAERYLLSKLNYDLAWPSPLTFMRRINEADGFDPRHRMLAKYLLELAQLDQRFVGCKPSILAAAAYLAACQILNLPWTEKHTRLAIYCADQLIPYVSVLLECCYMYQTSAVGEKYAQDAYYNIARTLPDYLDAAGFTYLGQRVMR